MKRKEKYDDFDEWETDVFRAGATQVLEVGENIFYAIRTPDNKRVQSDADGMFDLRSRRGREVMKTATTIGGWAGGSGEVYRHIVARAGKARPYENPARRPKESPLYVKYLSLKSDEEPFMMQGTKYEYVWAEYPGGIKDIGVYSYANDLVYSYDSFRQMMNLDRMNPRSRNAMNSEGLHFIWVLEKDRSAYLHVYKSLQKATSALNTFSKIKSGTIDPSIGRIGSRGISQLGHGIGNSKMTIDDIAAEVEKKYGVQPEVIRHDLDDGDTNPVRPRKGESVRDFTSRCMSEEKSSFPKTKQRIAVCLSKSRKRNPVYDTGSDE
jgi:hypothetical protein